MHDVLSRNYLVLSRCIYVDYRRHLEFLVVSLSVFKNIRKFLCSSVNLLAYNVPCCCPREMTTGSVGAALRRRNILGMYEVSTVVV